MRKVLVCGGSGYIGSHTVIELHRAGYTPVIVDNFSNSDQLVVHKLSKYLGVELDIYAADLTDKRSVIEIFSDVRPEAVIQLAGFKAVAESIHEPVKYYSENITITLNVLEAMSQLGTKRIVFSSSATVYGHPKYLPIDEGHPIAPINPYGRTKYFQELIIRDWLATKNDSECRAWILRYFNPVGAHASGLIGENPTNYPNNLLPIIGAVASGKKDKVVIFGDTYETRDGSCERDYVHVTDLASAHVACLQSAPGEQLEIFNVGTGKGVTVREAISIYSKCLERPISYEIGNKRSGDAAASIANNNKILQRLDWEPLYCFEHACRDDISWRGLRK